MAISGICVDSECRGWPIGGAYANVRFGDRASEICPSALHNQDVAVARLPWVHHHRTERSRTPRQARGDGGVDWVSGYANRSRQS